jgi:hypothetical protein
MKAKQAGESADIPPETLETIKASFRASEPIYRSMGSPLYAELCTGALADDDILALTQGAEASARPVHLFTAVHHLLLGDPDDPLSAFFPTLTEQPAPAEQAYPEFARYCRAHRDEILRLIDSHSVQMTYAERCRALLPPLALVAEQAGEPLNLVDIGCSAGVMLTFDHYAYEYAGHDRVGPADAPLTLAGELHGNPPLRIPAIGTRTGIDLNIVDVAAEEDRRWVLASTFPELRDEQARLARALDVVARTDIRFLQGDGLELLPHVLADTPSPLCIFHSATLFYWSPDAKASLEELLKESSRERDIYRVGLEPSEQFIAWQQGRGGGDSDGKDIPKGEIMVTRYRDGAAESRVVAHNNRADYGSVEWLD